MQVFDPEELERRRQAYMARREQVLALHERAQRSSSWLDTLISKFAMRVVYRECQQLKADIAAYEATLDELARTPPIRE